MRRTIINIVNNALMLNADEDESKKIPVGGQAVIEGVLMRAPNRWGLAIRKPEGDIFHEVWENKPWTLKLPWKLPLIRGVVTLIDMMCTGIKALNKSAEIALGEQEKLTKRDFFLAVAVAIFAVVGLFIALPLWVSDLCVRFFDFSVVQKNITEGVVRGFIFVGYVAIIGLWSDIKQVFRYHGAEHKTINAFESGVTDMTPEVVSKYSRIHPRCGTSFLLVVIVVSIIVFSFAGRGSLTWRVASRVVLLPVVMGISYEIIKGASRMGIFGKIIMYPMMLLQYLTTREPDLKQLEVSIDSLLIALDKDSEECE
ncbi:MAG: DUF1385 domain-containing protein [Synergistaceae bacterium]|nr:DUF1385 domain-containing protein [Synergistaceae bacterium]